MSKRNKKIHISEPHTARKLNFSFEHYDFRNEEYCISCWSKQQIKRTLQILKDVCQKNLNELYNNRKVYHFGEVIWERTIKKKGFENPSIDNLPAFHFSLLGVNGQLARAYGAFADDIFYIVWFDLEHTIWPTALKNT